MSKSPHSIVKGLSAEDLNHQHQNNANYNYYQSISRKNFNKLKRKEEVILATADQQAEKPILSLNTKTTSPKMIPHNKGNLEYPPDWEEFVDTQLSSKKRLQNDEEEALRRKALEEYPESILSRNGTKVVACLPSAQPVLLNVEMSASSPPTSSPGSPSALRRKASEIISSIGSVTSKRKPPSRSNTEMTLDSSTSGNMSQTVSPLGSRSVSSVSLGSSSSIPSIFSLFSRRDVEFKKDQEREEIRPDSDSDDE